MLRSVPDSHAFAPGLFDTRCFSQATINAAFARPVVDWYASETLESLLPKENALAIVSEILGNDDLINDSEALANKNWDRV